MTKLFESARAEVIGTPEAGDTLHVEASVRSVVAGPDGASVVSCDCTLVDDRSGRSAGLCVEVTIPAAERAPEPGGGFDELDLACPPL
jgi:hypothetical protein